MMKAIVSLLLVLSYACAVLSQTDACNDPSAPCCNDERLELFLSNGKVYGNLGDFGATVIFNQTSSNPNPNECEQQLVLQITFDPLVPNEKPCKPTCNRRLLNIDMYLYNPSGWTFNIGNSPSNYGPKGDQGDHGFDAHLVASNGDITAWSNDFCSTNNVYPNAAAQNGTVTVRLSNHFYEVISPDETGGSSCGDSCFFDLNDQEFDTQIQANNDLNMYVSFNRVIWPGSSNTGRGVCKATLTWECCRGSGPR